MVKVFIPSCRMCGFFNNTNFCYALCLEVAKDLERRTGSSRFLLTNCYDPHYCFIPVNLPLEQVQAIIALWRIKIPMLCKVPIEIEEKEDG